MKNNENKNRDSLLKTPDFASRHIGLSAKDEAEMLAAVGASSLEDLGEKIVPASIFQKEAAEIFPALSEHDALHLAETLAAQNKTARNFVGLGYYGAHTPEPLRRNILENPGWYTPYTPYQPEAAQGRLEMLLNFQTLAADLTGLELANASLLDEATAAAEAMTMLRRESKSKSHRFLADAALFPQTLAVLRTRAESQGMEVVVAAPEEFPALAEEEAGAFGAVFGYPSGDGEVRDHSAVTAALKKKKIFCACATDLLALMALRAPGEMGFAIAFGNSQRFGLPLGFGGPHAAFLSFDARFKRFAPGRIVGVSRDVRGARCLRLSLQTREQHIRREKATSNICTAQALPAIMAAAYAIYHGPASLAAIAGRAHRFAVTLAAILQKSGFALQHENFFDTLRVRAKDAAAIVSRAEKENYNLLLADDGTVGVSIDERTTADDIAAIARFFNAEEENINAALRAEKDGDTASGDFASLLKAGGAIPDSTIRRAPPLAHEVFNRFHTEHEMMRYLRRLASRDIALDRSMMPLGSCTMKLNAAAEMATISIKGFADVHPLAPPAQTRGYARLAAELSDMLAKLSGFDAVSLQPNSGAQGEYAGLLAIRAHHRARGEAGRNVCLIPVSAHGTNPASAVMAGMEVTPLKVGERGEVDMDDLREKCREHKDNLAALMITYPSTSGTFDENITKVCDIVHEAGGQVYLDGANFNALVGVAMPGRFGADVMHINLHKTFCIPHGGGGPGMGPIAMKKHLADVLPPHPFTLHHQNAAPESQSKSKQQGGGEKLSSAVAAAPLGSALILPISWMYCRMMGGGGLRRATLCALLSANYAAQKIAAHFPILFRGGGGFVAHECVADAREFKKSAGVDVEDIAKRLMDFGFHAPTVSWPVPGAIMIEPTECESREEIDRYCNALAAIHDEILKTASGADGWTRDDNPLKNAPHPADALLAADWPHPYSRAQAAYPAAWVMNDKFWPPVARADQVFGDRNLICACPLQMDDFEPEKDESQKD